MIELNIMEKKKSKIIILKIGMRIKNKRDKTTFEIKYINDKSVGLLSEDGAKFLLVPVDSITPNEYEPVYN